MFLLQHTYAHQTMNSLRHVYSYQRNAHNRIKQIHQNTQHGKTNQAKPISINLGLQESEI